MVLPNYILTISLWVNIVVAGTEVVSFGDNKDKSDPEMFAKENIEKFCKTWLNQSYGVGWKLTK